MDTVRRSFLHLGVLLVGLIAAVIAIDRPSQAAQGVAAAGTLHAHHPAADRLARTYDRWRSSKYRDGSDYQVVVGLSWFPGISVERSEARGKALIDMPTATVAVELEGMDPDSASEVWLVDNRSGEGASAKPDHGDAMILLGPLKMEGGKAELVTSLKPDALLDFDIDIVVVARRGEGPVEGGLLYGALSLFERIYRVSWRIEQGLSPVATAQESESALWNDLPHRDATATESPEMLRVLETLIANGRNIFFEETFEGNGRTCGTCHPADNNFTLDKKFIEGLPPEDPLFVAETIDELNHELNGGLYFENPVLMREFGLIVVNADGFEDPANKYVLRSINHLFALALTTQPAETNCNGVPPDHRLGWGGDGAPGSGTLREFAIGAVIQHNPLTLGRVEGEDFRLPTDEELDALEAFQLELGRRADLKLGRMTFFDLDVAAGRDLFVGETARCGLCHEGAGALRRVPGVGENFNFDVGHRHVPHPALALGEPMPFDDGFLTGQENPHCANGFSTPSLIEAADTAPFGHNNVFRTLEEAIAHYSTPAFNDHSSAGGSLNGPINLTELEIDQIGSFLRTLNALQNIDDVRVCGNRIRRLSNLQRSQDELEACLADNRDALDVLSEGPLAPLYEAAQEHLAGSHTLYLEAQLASTIPERDTALAAAALELQSARELMAEQSE